MIYLKVFLVFVFLWLALSIIGFTSQCFLQADGCLSVLQYVSAAKTELEASAFIIFLMFLVKSVAIFRAK